MKWIATILLTVSTVVGALAASTAYLVRIDDLQEYLTDHPERATAESAPRLAAEAGVMPVDAMTADDERPTPQPEPQPEPEADSQLEEEPAEEPQPQPIAATGAPATPELLAQLEAAGVTTIRIREFHFEFWTWRWWFIAACFGLLAAGFINRVAAGGAGAATMATAGDLAPGAIGGELESAPLAAALARTRGLIAEVDSIDRDELRNRRIIEVIEHEIQPSLLAFVDQRGALLRAAGLSRFAEVMDAFSEGERAINRAWSAAVDRVSAESIDSLQRAIEPLERAVAGRTAVTGA